MALKDFNELIKKVQGFTAKKKVAVVVAEDEHTLEAVFQGVDNNIVDPILIGNKKAIKEVLDNLNRNIDHENIIDICDHSEAAEKGVELINIGKADFLMKGKIQTKDLLKAVVNREKGLRTGSIISHIAINEVPTYHKLLITTDGGMNLNPSLEEKKQIIDNAVNTLLNLGYEKPNVAVLAAVENVNPKMIESVDAKALKNMNEDGVIKNCFVEGPISYDLTFSKEAAEIKGFSSPVVGEADILVVPNITAGNILGKALIHSANAKMAGLIVGAKVPIVLTSRGSSAEEKYLSIALAAAVSKKD